MSTTVAELVARLSADTDRFDRDMKRSDSSFKKVGKSIGKAALGIGTAVGVGLGITAKIGWDEFNEGQRVAAQTNAVLKSTGGVANVTAKEVDALATSLMNKSGVDDEAIKAGQNMLLTFKQIRNESGKGNDVFNQATKATLDLSVAMGKDMADSSIMVGKALNDPIKGITAMRRVGIQFTSAQEDQIKAMVESGDVMGAQKLILRELESQFGGSAEAAGKTLPGQLDILKQTFSNTAGEIVGRFVPPLVRFATWLAPLILQALDAIGGFLDRAKERFAGAGGTAAAVWPRVVGALQSVWAFVKEKIFPIIGQLRDIWTTAVQRIAAVLMEHEPQLRRIWERVGKAVQLLAKIAIPILRFIFTEVLPRAIGIALKAMDKATGAIETILKTAQRLGRWFKGSFAGFFTSAWQGIKDLFFDATRWILGQFLGFAERMLKLADKGFGWIPGLGGKIDDARDKISGMRNELDRITRRRYAIRFVTNAARVKSDIEDLRAGLPGRSGDVRHLDIAPSRAMSGVDSRLFGALGLAQQMGLAVSSTYRPGATVAGSGSRSDHSYFPSKAIDFAGSSSRMVSFARAVTRLSGIDTVIHSPVGLWRDGFWGAIQSAVTKRDHYDHVHVDTFDRGGWLPPRSATLAINRTSQWEPVGPPGRGGLTVNVNVGNWFGSDRESARKLAAFLVPHIDRAVRMNTGHA